MKNNKTKEVYENYVCPSCFNKLYECSCEHGFLPYTLLMIDEGIQEHVRVLNQKGYTTLDSCESHTRHENMYISFVRDYGFGKTLPMPEGFDKLKRNNAVSVMYGRSLTDEEFEDKKKEYLSNLLEWCNNLPSRTNSNIS